MRNRPSLRVICFSVILVGVLAVAGPSATVGQFDDGHVGTSSFSAAENFNNADNNPSGNKVYDDVNENGEYDSNVDRTINKNQLDDYDNASANLVISSNIGELAPNNKPVSIRAESITSEVPITASTDAGVTLEAVSGEVDLSGNSVTGKNGPVDVSASDRVILDGATVTSDTSSLTVTAKSISARNAVLNATSLVVLGATNDGGGVIDGTGLAVNTDGTTSISADEQLQFSSSSLASSGGITLSTSSTIDLDEATLDSPNGQLGVHGRNVDAVDANLSSQNQDVTIAANQSGGGTIDAARIDVQSNAGDIAFLSNGNITVDVGELTATNQGITADLTTENATLFVNETVITDADDTLVYGPDDITVSGSPNGNTSP